MKNKVVYEKIAKAQKTTEKNLLISLNDEKYFFQSTFSSIMLDGHIYIPVFDYLNFKQLKWNWPFQ